MTIIDKVNDFLDFLFLEKLKDAEILRLETWYSKDSLIMDFEGSECTTLEILQKVIKQRNNNLGGCLDYSRAELISLVNKYGCEVLDVEPSHAPQFIIGLGTKV